jgi:hypothetical protein
MSFFLGPHPCVVKRFAFAAFLLLFGLSEQAESQSGRRAVKPSPSASPTASPVSTNEATETHTPKQPEPGQLQHKIRLLVARQPTSHRLPAEDQIFASFVTHLNEHENIEASSIGDVKERQAVERAKGETDAFVILLKFDIDNFQSGTIILNSQDLQLDYCAFAPHTGKKQTKGKVYYQTIGGGRLRKSDWPNGTPIRITPEAAGIEAAEGLYFWLKLEAMNKP